MHLVIAVLALALSAGSAEAALKIYYIRHAEGGHNVKKDYKNVPKSEWPDYVGNGNVFTPKGKTQVAAATEKLKQYQFDFIAVSPMWRTRNTILPYLKAINARGEVWPEMHEFSGGSMILSKDLPKTSGKIIEAGDPVEIPADEAKYFHLREGATNDFKLPEGKGEEHEAGVRLVTERVAQMLKEKFGGSDKTILMVGHGNAGKALLRLLMNDELKDLDSMVNTGIWMVEEQPNGKFQLKMYNDTPYRTGAKSESRSK
jgi:broad specificity phosphatase PhoE